MFNLQRDLLVGNMPSQKGEEEIEFSYIGFHTVEVPRIFRQPALESGKLVSLKHWPPLPQGRSLVFVSVRG
jgi:hypothetical protein